MGFRKDNMSEYCKNCYELQEQLKHKEQECEEFKKQLERKEENYQKLLSKSNKYIHNLVNENVQDISNLARQLDQLKAKYDKIKNCLAEIKEIAENMNKECFYDDFECKDCDMKNGCTYFNKRQILQKISECEVENER